MNVKLITFSSLVTAAIGAVLGLAVLEMRAPKYESQFYRDLKDNYALIGAGIGVAVGATQEMVRQLKKKQEKEFHQELLQYHWDSNPLGEDRH